MNRRVAALVVIIMALLTGPLTAAALAAPDTRPAQADADEDGPLRLEFDELAPRVVTADGPTVLTVTGVLTNTGGDPVDELGVRLQRGLPLTTEGQVRDTLDGGAPTDAIEPRFQQLPDRLAPGEQVPVRLTVPLRGDPESTLALSGTGVYELLVNVNGAPEGGDRARLAAVRFLLPVLGLPAGPDGSEPVTPELSTRTPFALLYPITHEPRRLPTMPGEPTLLTDDTLADSFTAGGRLGGLVAALGAASDPARAATCVAVDPDLVQTAEAMAGGYQVLGDDGSLVPGRGAEAAAAWLAGLRAAVAGGCVLALPFADADLVALGRGGLADPALDAVAAGAAIASAVLQTPVLDGTTWPVDGVVDESTRDMLAEGGTTSLLLSGNGVRDGGPSGVVPVGPSTTAVLADPLLTLAAGGVQAQDAVVTGVGTAVDPTTARGALATQDVLGAVAFRATENPPEGAPLVLAPPHSWDADGAAAQALLDGVDRFVTAGLLTPRDLGEIVRAGPPAGADDIALQYPLAAGGREIPASVVASVVGVRGDIADLRSSVVPDGQGIDPAAAFDPLLRGALRPASAAWRGEPAEAASFAVAGVQRISDVRGSVTVLEPASPFSLGSSDSPLLLTVANGLPVTMRVRVELASTSGLRVAPIPAVEIPPLGRRQVQVNAEVLRSGVFTVDASVRTQDGGLLGPPSRLQVRSTAYGTITLWLTGTAAVALVVLAGRRILRRVRTEPGRHHDGRPPTPVPERGATAEPRPTRAAADRPPKPPLPTSNSSSAPSRHPPGREATRVGRSTTRRATASIDPEPTVPLRAEPSRAAPSRAAPGRAEPSPNLRPSGPIRPGLHTGPNPPAPSVHRSAAAPGPTVPASPRPPAGQARPQAAPPATVTPADPTVPPTAGPHRRPDPPRPRDLPPPGHIPGFR